MSAKHTVSQKDSVLGFIANTSRTRLLGVVVGGYLACVLVFALLYRVTDSVQGATTFQDVAFFSLVTQTTVGYGNFVPESGLGTVLASFQILAGVVWVAFLPALILIRLASPHDQSLRLDKYLAFDLDLSVFRLRLVNQGRFVGTRTEIKIWLRTAKRDRTGFRSLPVLIRDSIPADLRFPHLRPMLPTALRTSPAEQPEIGLAMGAIKLHPAHMAHDSSVVIEANVDTPFGPSRARREYGATEVVCGKHRDVQQSIDAGAEFHWENFDQVDVRTATDEGRTYCLEACAFRARCQLVSKVNA